MANSLDHSDVKIYCLFYNYDGLKGALSVCARKCLATTPQRQVRMEKYEMGTYVERVGRAVCKDSEAKRKMKYSSNIAKPRSET